MSAHPPSSTDHDPDEIRAEVSPTIDGSPATEPLPPPQPVPPGLMSRLGSLLLMALPVVCMFQAGILVNWIFLRKEPPPRTIVVKVKEEPKEHQKAEYNRRDGDALLRIGEYESALRIYQSIGEANRLPTEVMYRIGLCQEGLKRWDEALEAFRYVTTSVDPVDVAAAQLATARVNIRRRTFGRAREPLCRLLLRSGAPEMKTGPFRDDSLYLLGLVYAEAFENVTIRPGDGPQVVHSSYDWPVEKALMYMKHDDVETLRSRHQAARESAATTFVSLDETQAPTDPADPSNTPGTDKTPDPDKPSEPSEPQPAAPTPDASAPKSDATDDEWTLKTEGVLLPLVEVTATGNSVPVRDLVEQTAMRHNVRVEWSNRAADLTRNRFVNLHVEKLPVFAVWVGALEPLGITWEVRQATLTLVATEELQSKVLKSTRHNLGREILSIATRLAPKHELMRMAKLEIGNYEYNHENYKAATASYKEAVDRTSNMTSLAAAFNLAITQQKQGRRDEARLALFKVADGDTSNRLGPHAFLSLGRMYLDDMMPEDAMLPLKRAVAADSAPDFRELTVINLAMAYILASDYRNAGALMDLNRGVLRGSRHHNLSAFLVAYARYKTIKDKQKLTTTDLIKSLLALGDKQEWHGIPESLLVGRAYRELRMEHEMSEVFRDAMKLKPPPHVSEEMEYALAAYGVLHGSREPAKRQLARIYKEGRTIWRGLSGLKLAEIAEEDKRHRDCVNYCKELLTQSDFLETTKTLDLMGRSYEHLGEYEKASLCYAGQIAKLFARLNKDALDAPSETPTEPKSDTKPAPRPQPGLEPAS